jgi:hypothetical protein
MLRARLRVSAILLLLTASGGTAFCQQVAFTSRTYVQSPVVITSVEPSKEFGFDSVVLRNDGPNAISAVHFQLTFRTDAGDEIADERRVPVILDSRGSKRVLVGLAQIEAFKQQAKSRKVELALVILTIESVEFEDGGEWKQTERDRGTPIDPVNAPQELQRKK